MIPAVKFFLTEGLQSHDDDDSSDSEVIIIINLSVGGVL